MATTTVPTSLFCSCQVASNPNVCILPVRQLQSWRLRAQGIPGMAVHTPQWRLRVSAESTESVTEESVETPSEEVEKTQEAAEAETEAAKEPSADTTLADHLVMMIKAEGSMPDVSIPIVQTALEEMEDVSDVKISTFEGLTSISLTKRTVIQATNVASELVDAMEKAGFRMHTLNLAIDDDDE